MHAGRNLFSWRVILCTFQVNTYVPPILPEHGPKFSVWDGLTVMLFHLKCASNFFISFFNFNSILSIYLNSIGKGKAFRGLLSHIFWSLVIWYALLKRDPSKGILFDTIDILQFFYTPRDQNKNVLKEHTL